MQEMRTISDARSCPPLTWGRYSSARSSYAGRSPASSSHPPVPNELSTASPGSTPASAKASRTASRDSPCHSDSGSAASSSPAVVAASRAQAPNLASAAPTHGVPAARSLSRPQKAKAATGRNSSPLRICENIIADVIAMRASA